MSDARGEIQPGSVRSEDFVNSRIPPSWVLDGDPRTRSCDLSASGDGGLTMNLWECTAGRFRWTYRGDELIQVLEGEVRVTGLDGRTTVLRAGSTAHFAAGTELVWEVPEYVKKLAIHRGPSTIPGRVVHKLRVSWILARRRRSADLRVAGIAGPFTEYAAPLAGVAAALAG